MSFKDDRDQEIVNRVDFKKIRETELKNSENLVANVKQRQQNKSKSTRTARGKLRLLLSNDFNPVEL